MESLDDWLNLMNNEYLNSNGFNVQTVDQAIPIYAPASDGNDTSVYINAVRSRVSEWRQREAQDPESDLNAGSSDLVSSKFDEFINADGVPVIEGSAFPVVGYSADSVPLHHSQSAGASDLMAPRGTPIVSFRTGTVSFSGWDNTGGWSVMMQNDDGTEAYYAHMNSQPVAQAGQRVEAGELIGEVGNTGNAQATDPHLHFAFGTGGINLGAGPNGGAYLSTNVVGELDELLSLSRLAGDWSTV
jgi:murein DD-endopeptidase MepM/ murein hydrolase activator NlpD